MKKNILVVHIIARMNVGGPAFLIDSLIKNLNDDKFESILVTGYCESNEIDFLESRKKTYQVYRIRNFGRSLGLRKDLQCLLELIKIIREVGPDIVHTHTAKAGILGRIAAFLAFRKVRIVHTFHGHLLHGYFSPQKTELLILIERLMSKITDSFIAVGNSVKQDLLERKIGSKNRFHVIFPGLSAPYLDPEKVERNRLAFPRKRISRIVFIGRLTSIKSPHRIIDLANILSQRNIDFEILVIGGGELLPILKSLPLENPASVKFLGWRDDIYELISTADLGILTSQNEGIPLTLIQFAQMGLPVVSTSVGSVSDVVEDGKTGYLLDFNILTFADAIEFLIRDNFTAKMFGENAKKRAEKLFSVQGMVSKHRDLYYEVLNI
jgi:glycosyltransferase involved in cell wall biosynthesis